MPATPKFQPLLEQIVAREPVFAFFDVPVFAFFDERVSAEPRALFVPPMYLPLVCDRVVAMFYSICWKITRTP